MRTKKGRGLVCQFQWDGPIQTDSCVWTGLRRRFGPKVLGPESEEQNAKLQIQAYMFMHMVLLHYYYIFDICTNTLAFIQYRAVDGKESFVNRILFLHLEESDT